MAAQTSAFDSKVDRLLLLAIAIPLLAGTVGAIIVSFRVPIAWVSAALLLIADAFVLWVYSRTDYSIVDGELRIRSGPFRWRIALQDIHSVSPSRSILSSPALSLDRLEIRHGHRGAILVSPAKRSEFLDALARSSPGLVVSAGGLLRGTSHAQ